MQPCKTAPPVVPMIELLLALLCGTLLLTFDLCGLCWHCVGSVWGMCARRDWEMGNGAWGLGHVAWVQALETMTGLSQTELRGQPLSSIMREEDVAAVQPTLRRALSGAHPPSPAMPCRAMSCRVMPCRAMPCLAMPCRAMPCRTMPCLVCGIALLRPPCHCCRCGCHVAWGEYGLPQLTAHSAQRTHSLTHSLAHPRRRADSVAGPGGDHSGVPPVALAGRHSCDAAQSVSAGPGSGDCSLLCCCSSGCVYLCLAGWLWVWT